jgi:AcrR family transcriptional regulator
MADQKRPYRMKRRAELEEETRRRITESAVELHGTLGPTRTSISAIAEHAGVRRSTVYRHFPDEEALFVACTGHWRASNPPPDLEVWAAIEDPVERLRHALDELYAYYRSTHGMLANVLRDEALSPLVARMLAGYYEYLAAAHETLMARRAARGGSRRRTRAAIGLALAFATWRSLTLEQGLDDAQAAGLMCRLVAAAAPR